MVKRWVLLSGLVLLGRCHSFHVPLVSRGLDRELALPQLREPPIHGKGYVQTTSSPHVASPLGHLHALVPSTGVNPGSGGKKDSAESPAPYTPSFLWWTKSRAEEDATINLVANAGFIAAVGFFALVTFLTVDVDVSRGWTASELFWRMPIDNWAAYSEVLRNNPVLVKACTSGVVYFLGDWTAQTVEGIPLSDLKRGRVLRSAMAGLLLHGPMSHVWYGVCEAGFNTIGWNEYWWVTVPKIAVDQVFWGPFWNAVYILFLGVLKKDSVATIWEAITSTALPLVVAGLRLWPLAHVITYGLVPTENRLLWVDFVEIVWVTILSRQAADQARTAGEQAVVGDTTLSVTSDVFEREDLDMAHESHHGSSEFTAMSVGEESKLMVDGSANWKN